MNVITVKGFTKVYRIPKKEEGLSGSIKSLFNRKYENKIAVDNISFSIKKGEFIGFIGPNGAGKTTTIKMLSGIIYPTSGSINVLGHVPQKLNNEFKKRFSVVMGQKNQLWWDIPAADSFLLFKEIYQIPEEKYKKNVEELTKLLNVESLLNIPVRNLSLGERMKMELIATMLHEPEVIFLDEPTIGLDVFSRRKIRDFLKHINKEKKITIILTSHYIEDIKALCSRIIAIQKGKIVFDGPFEDISTDLIDSKQITVNFENEQFIKRLERYGQILEVNSNKAIFLVKKNMIREFCAAITSDEDFSDMNIEDVPVDEIFEKLFDVKEGVQV